MRSIIIVASPPLPKELASTAIHWQTRLAVQVARVLAISCMLSSVHFPFMSGPVLVRGSSSSFHKHVFRLLKPASVSHLIFVLLETLLQQAETCMRLLPHSKQLFGISPPAIFSVPIFPIHPLSELLISAQKPLIEKDFNPRLPPNTETLEHTALASIFTPLGHDPLHNPVLLRPRLAALLQRPQHSTHTE